MSRLIRLVPDCLGLLRRLLRDRDTPGRARLVAVVAIAYLAFPFDVIPDVVPGLGQLDDLLVIAWALRRIVGSAGRERVAHHWQGDPVTLESILRRAGVT